MQRTIFNKIFTVVLCLVFLIGATSLAAYSGKVRLEYKTLKDSSGYFLGFGATYFQALRHAIDRDPVLEQNLNFLRARKVNFIRILAMVHGGGWPANRSILPDEPRYWEGFRELLDKAWARGIRVQITLFAATGYLNQMNGLSEQDQYITDLINNVVKTRDAANISRADKIVVFEIANEWYHNSQSFTANRIKNLVRKLKTRLGGGYNTIPIAASSPRNKSASEINQIYQAGYPTLATFHFSRKTHLQNGWNPVLDCENIYSILNGTSVGAIPASSNEPVGPGSSGRSENRPSRLVMAAAFAWANNLPIYTFHSGVGVGIHTNLPKAFSDGHMPGLRQIGKLVEELPTGLPGLQAYMPFYVSGGNCLRMIGKKRYRKRWIFIVGANNLKLKAHSENLEIDVFDPHTMNKLVDNLVLNHGQELNLAAWGKDAYIIKARKL